MSTHPKERVVRFSAPMPKGYHFVSKGNVFVTGQCRKRAHAAGHQVYVVQDKSKKTLGIRCPKQIIDKVRAAERATRAQRRANTNRREKAKQQEFSDSVKQLFPAMPQEDVVRICTRALQKRSGRVGRTATLPLAKRVRLAVRAHIRHYHTGYDTLLRSDVEKHRARDMVNPSIQKVISRWSKTRQPSLDKPASEQLDRSNETRSSGSPEVITISDSDESDLEIISVSSVSDVD